MTVKYYQNLYTPANNLRLDVVENALFQGDRIWNHQSVTSPFNRLYFVLSGEGFIENSKHKVVLHPGKAYLIPAKSTYSYVCEETIIKYYLHFNLQFLPGVDVFESLGDCISLTYPIEAIQKLLVLLEEDTLPAFMRFKAELELLLADFMDKAIEDFQIEWKYDAYEKYIKLLDIINKHLTAEIKISDLAKIMNLPYNTLSKNFKRDTGVGLKNFIEKMLATKAKQLLLTTDLSIGEIASELCFSDQYYFSRFFKKQDYISPREYRQKNKITFITKK